MKTGENIEGETNRLERYRPRIAQRDVHVAKGASLDRPILPLVLGKGLEILPPLSKTRERERTLSSQIAVEGKCVAQSVGS
jgi:hypothetical protein